MPTIEELLAEGLKPIMEKKTAEIVGETVHVATLLREITIQEVENVAESGYKDPEDEERIIASIVYTTHALNSLLYERCVKVLGPDHDLTRMIGDANCTLAEAAAHAERNEET